MVSSGLTKKAEPPPTRGVNRDSGTASGNGGWLRRLVRPLDYVCHISTFRLKSLDRLDPQIIAIASRNRGSWRHNPFNVSQCVCPCRIRNHSIHCETSL